MVKKKFYNVPEKKYNPVYSIILLIVFGVLFGSLLGKATYDAYQHNKSTQIEFALIDERTKCNSEKVDEWFDGYELGRKISQSQYKEHYNKGVLHMYLCIQNNGLEECTRRLTNLFQKDEN